MKKWFRRLLRNWLFTERVWKPDPQSIPGIWKALPGNEHKTELDFIHAFSVTTSSEFAAKLNEAKTAYQLWLALPGNAGKSYQQFEASVSGGELGEGHPNQ